MENLFKVIAEKCKVQLQEEFLLKGEPVHYKLTETGMYFYEDKDWEMVDIIGLTNFLSGEFDIVKLPFKPKFGEKYYYIRFWEEGEKTFRTQIKVKKNSNSSLDYLVGNQDGCFRTYEEARDNIQTYFEEVTGHSIKEVRLIAPPNYACEVKQ